MFIPNTWNIFHKSGYSWISHVEISRFVNSLSSGYLGVSWFFSGFFMIFLSAYLDLTHVLCQFSPQKSPVDLQALWAHSGWTMPPEICSDLDHFLRQLYTHIHWNIYICIHTIMYIYIYVCVKYPWKWPVHIFKSTAGKPYVSTLYQFQSWCFKSYYNIYIYMNVFSYTGCLWRCIWINPHLTELRRLGSSWLSIWGIWAEKRFWAGLVTNGASALGAGHPWISMAFRMFIVGYPLVNVYIVAGKSPSIGKSTN